jgi:hypothetical protein
MSGVSSSRKSKVRQRKPPAVLTNCRHGSNGCRAREGTPMLRLARFAVGCVKRFRANTPGWRIAGTLDGQMHGWSQTPVCQRQKGSTHPTKPILRELHRSRQKICPRHRLNAVLRTSGYPKSQSEFWRIPRRDENAWHDVHWPPHNRIDQIAGNRVFFPAFRDIPPHILSILSSIAFVLFRLRSRPQCFDISARPGLPAC